MGASEVDTGPSTEHLTASDGRVAGMRVQRIDHVQLAMPAGGEDDAAAFYEGLLGIPRVPKPEPLAARGGCWFVDGEVQLHLGVEDDFRPARKAHPALVVEGLAKLVERLRAAGVEVREAEDYFEGIDETAPDAKVLQLVGKLIEERTSEWAPSMVEDPVQKRLKSIIAAKKRKQKPAAKKDGAKPAEPDDTPDNVVSIMDALRKSLSAEKAGRKGR